MDDPGPDESVDDATIRVWLIAFALTTVGTILVVVSNPGASRADSVASALLVLTPQAVYWLFARPDQVGIRQGRLAGWAFAVLAVATFGLAQPLNPWASLSLFAVTPQLFILLPFPAAAGSVVALNLAPIAVGIVRGTLPADDVVQSVGQAAFIVTFSLFFSSRLISEVRRSRERQRLLDELNERQAEIAAMSAERGAEAERARIAREMHDTLAQGFASIVTLGHAVREELDADPVTARRHVELITLTAQENLTESRRIIAALTPARLDDASLPQAIERIVDRFADETGTTATTTLDGRVRPATPATEVVALRIVQEALANVRRHAQAAQVDVCIDFGEDGLRVSVRDDGIGFDAGSGSTGYGLVGMKARVAEVGGRLEIESRPGSGCAVRAVLPLGSTA